MEHGCVPVRRMPTSFVAASIHAQPISQADREELEAYYERQEKARNRKTAKSLESYLQMRKPL